jgi:hypothetical protein
MKKTVAFLHSLLLLACAIRLMPTASATNAVDAPEPVSLDGIIHPDSDDTLVFTPDGNTVFFDRSEGKHKTILISHKTGGHWSKASSRILFRKLV